MAFGSFQSRAAPAMMSDINVTPMLDVVLVLLVIFMLAAPLLTHRLPLQLPVAGKSAPAARVARLVIAIDAGGATYLDGVPVSQAQLDRGLAHAAASRPQPELQLMADQATRYATLAQVMASAQARGLNNIVFITEPHKENHHGQR